MPRFRLLGVAPRFDGASNLESELNAQAPSGYHLVNTVFVQPLNLVVFVFEIDAPVPPPLRFEVEQII